MAAGIKVIATKQCPSLSGKSTLTYKLGRDDAGTLYLRLHEGTGGGFFNDEWIKAEDLAAALQAHQGDDGMSSMVLAHLFRGRSANTQAFFAAVLRNEGALLPYKRGSRLHKVGDLNAFLQQSAGKTTARKAPAQRKPRAKAKTAPARKTKASTAA
jgi:hypothetical protein